MANSKSYIREAHDRNKAKRLIFEAVRRVYSELPSNINLVMMPRISILKKSVDEISHIIEDVKINNFSN